MRPIQGYTKSYSPKRTLISYPFDIVEFVWYGPIMAIEENILHFNENQIDVVNQAVNMAEELVSNFFKMSATEWLRPRYDIKTLVELQPQEVVDTHFAQIIRYEGKRKGSDLSTDSYDYYKICIQDHNILRAIRENPKLSLNPFCVYVVSHELIHIVRFSKFLQNFEASQNEKMAEERRVHAITRDMLLKVQLENLDDVLTFYSKWH